MLGLALALVLTGSYASAQAAGLERIPSPDQIKHFRVMEKVGNALYGIRVENLSATSDAAKPAEARSLTNARETATLVSGQVLNRTNVAETLEKIAAPHLLPMYDKIRQVGNALWGVKKEMPGSQERDGADKPAVRVEDKTGTQEGKNQVRPATISGQTASCVIAAIDSKDLALSEHALAVATDLRNAISVRSACQKAALITTSNQRAELDICLKAFRASHQGINERQKQAHITIWDSYRASLKTCQANASGLEEGTSIIVEDGSENLVNSIMNTVAQ